MILLDTNVVSEPPKPMGNARVIAWFNRQPKDSLYLSAVSVAELQTGVAMLPEGRRKRNLQQIVNDTLAGLVTPILPFDRAAALAYAEIVVRAKAKKYTLSVPDGFIAAIAAAHGFAVATATWIRSAQRGLR
jgi:predicted nucleic acid-binding protein